MRLKDVAILNPKYDGEDLDTELVSFSPMECLRYDNLRPYTIPFKDARGKYTYFANNDVLFAKVTPCFENLNTAIASNLLNGIGFGSSEINVLRFSDKCYTRYFFYLICSRQFIDNGCASMSGVGGLKRVNPLAVTTFEFDLPLLFEQEAIADYLDKECDKITREIDLLKRKVGSYRRMKRSLINYAVMRGLDSQIKTKKSEGSLSLIIPFHWTEQRIKDIFTEVSMKGYPNEPMLCATQTRGVIPQSMYGNRVVAALTGLENMKLVEEGNFVISLRSFQGGIEYAYYRGIISAAYTILKLEEGQDKGFYKYFFKSASLIKLMKKCVTGIREGQNINYSILKYEMIPVPPLEEQREIVNYLDDKCSKIDSIIEKIELKIERLKELKRSLINEVVTGQRTIKTSDL